MTRSEVVKFRVTPRLKAALVTVAGRADTSISDLLRDAAGHVVGRQSPDGAAVRADMLTVRLLANAVLAWCEGSALEGDELRELADAGERLRTVAARHLRPPS